MAFEALNHAGSLPVDLLVVLNDNDMSISENVGALSNYLARVISEPAVRAAARRRQASAAATARSARARAPLRRARQGHGAARHAVRGDGLQLRRADRRARSARAAAGAADGARRCPARSCCTWSRARARATRPPRPIRSPGTARGPSIAASGTIHKEKAASPSYSQVFGRWLCDMAERDPRIIGITPAMREGSGLVEFSRRFPERYFDVAIAEQHAVTFAAGLACEGLRPVVAIYSTFLQRGYDQTIHDVALQNLPVVFALDRAGLVGGDGATHQGSYDLSFLRCIPNMVIMAPADENECRQMLYTATTLDGPGGRALSARPGPGRGDSTRSSPRCRSGARSCAARAAAAWRCSPSAACSPRRSPSASASMPPWSTCASSSRSMWRCCARSRRTHAALDHARGERRRGRRRQRLLRGCSMRPVS